MSADLFRVHSDDPDYLRQAAAEAAFWSTIHPLGFEQTETMFMSGPVEKHLNERFTGRLDTEWTATIPRWGRFRRGLMLGVSSPKREAQVLEACPELRLTVMDISEGAVARSAATLKAKFGDRVDTAVGDLNFLTLPAERYDLIVSSCTVHHVTNLEHLAFQINRALTPDGCCFLEDYVGEPRFNFSPAKRALYDVIYHRDLARQRGRRSGLVWLDDSDLSPFCGVRSDEILDVFRRYLRETMLRTAAALTGSMSRSRAVDMDELWNNVPRWKIAAGMWAHRLGIPLPIIKIDRRFLEELYLVEDAASAAGLITPCVAFAVYRKLGPSGAPPTAP